VTRPDIVEALTGARFSPVELTDRCWDGRRAINGYVPAGLGHREEVGRTAEIRLEFGDLLDGPWLNVATTGRGEFDRRDAGNGYVQVFTHETAPEEKARAVLHSAIAFSNVMPRLKAGEKDPQDWVSDEEWEAIKKAQPQIIRLELDAETQDFCLLRLAGCVAGSATTDDRTITFFGSFEPSRIELRTVPDIRRYFTSPPA
jgi:hypothetical protein